MKRCIFIIVLLYIVSMPVSAMEFVAPDAPDTAQPYMPDADETFAQGLWHILKTALSLIQPQLFDTAGMCLSVIAIVLVLSILKSFSNDTQSSVRLTGAVILGLILLEPMGTMIRLGSDTVCQLSDYCKLILPVMTSALAAQGGTTISAALYTGTAFFNALLGSIISGIVVPALYIYLCVCVAACALEQELLKKIQNTVKWFMIWLMKWTLYLFTGYISVTGIISGTVDASVLKATKISISGAVPVVGGILSDATETILVSAGLLKNAAGVYGIFAVLSICVGPFVKIGIPYILLKLTAGATDMLDYKPAATLVQNFTTGMGLVLAMTGTVCVMLLISLVCFMKGLG